MNRDETLTTAAALINGDRAKDYGDASVNFQRIADLWFPIVGYVTPAKVALMLAQLKVARLIQSPTHEDSWVDACGYLALGAELAASEAGTPEPQTSPAKPAPNASQPGLRVGARVKIIHRPFSFTPHVGREALIKEEVVAGAWYQLALDGKGAKFMYRADELEVIE